jgi:hypothetical protein
VAKKSRLERGSVKQINLLESNYDLIDRITGEILRGTVTFAPKKSNSESYHRFFRVPIDMLQLVFLQNLTATDIEILLLLMKNSIKNNVVAYDIHGFAETLGLSETSIKKNFMKLKKLNFIKRVKLGKPFSLLQISPHLAWMGDTESLEVALKEWPYPQVPEDRYEKFKYFEDRYSKFVKSERKRIFF